MWEQRAYKGTRWTRKKYQGWTCFRNDLTPHQMAQFDLIIIFVRWLTSNRFILTIFVNKNLCSKNKKKQPNHPVPRIITNMVWLRVDFNDADSCAYLARPNGLSNSPTLSRGFLRTLCWFKTQKKPANYAHQNKHNGCLFVDSPFELKAIIPSVAGCVSNKRRSFGAAVTT